MQVEAVLKSMSAWVGSDIWVQGVLAFEFEHVALYATLEDLKHSRYESSIWISVGMGSLRFDDRVCGKLHRKPVVVAGTLLAPLPKLGGCGHFSAWPAEILARTLHAA